MLKGKEVSTFIRATTGDGVADAPESLGNDIRRGAVGQRYDLGGDGGLQEGPLVLGAGLGSCDVADSPQAFFQGLGTARMHVVHELLKDVGLQHKVNDASIFRTQYAAEVRQRRNEKAFVL